MTRLASRHANNVTRKSNRSLNFAHTRNPWSSSTDSANGSKANGSKSRPSIYRTLSGPGPPVYQENVIGGPRTTKCFSPHYSSYVTMPRSKGRKLHAQYAAARGMPSPPIATAPTRINANAVACAAQTSQPKYFEHLTAVAGGQSTSRTSSDRAATPASLMSTTDGIVDPCGGHCKTFERCCHYILQVLFVIGILSGISLVLAAYWLHNQRRNSDQLVLVYIGVVMALVCALLLAIQCSAEREVKRKKRCRRAAVALLRSRSHSEVPMRILNGGRSCVYAARDVADSVSTQHMYCEMPLLYNPYRGDNQTARSCDEMSQSQNGIPWWRRYEMEVTSKSDNVV